MYGRTHKEIVDGLKDVIAEERREKLEWRDRALKGTMRLGDAVATAETLATKAANN